VRAFRRSFELTLNEIEKLTGIPQSNLSAIENDKLDMGVRRAIRIAAVFGINPSLILFPQGYEREDEKEIKKIRKDAALLIEKKRSSA
jgi:transcriptional regulator with XRE-family HTH domain